MTDKPDYWSALASANPYWKLRPPPPTPPEELCDCERLVGIVLQYALTYNPLACSQCRNEIPPERIGFGVDLAEEIAGWRSTYADLYGLWLDSGEYEQWAAERLLDPNGEVNVAGRKIVDQLNAFASTYYLWFHPDPPPLGLNEIDECPVCNAELEDSEHRYLRACHVCRILI